MLGWVLNEPLFFAKKYVDISKYAEALATCIFFETTYLFLLWDPTFSF